MSVTLDVPAGVPVDPAPQWPELLQAACLGQGLRSVYQPIIDVARGVVAGYEALIRFDRGPTDPQLWFAAARAHCVEAELDAAALRSGLSNRLALPGNSFLTVNVSPASLLSPLVRSVWAEQASLNGVVVEITEQTVIDSYAALEPDINRLRAAGALIAVDDAGAGYAGLNHLLMLRPEIIKLDRALVMDLDIDETKRALTEMLGTFAGRIDAWLLAEGIERTGELETLADLGVPLAQGYYLARPGPPWVPLNPEAAMQLATRSRQLVRNTLRTILQVAPYVHSLAEIGSVFDNPAIEVIALVGADHRPIGTLTADAAMVGLVESGMKLNVDTPISEAALRAITRGRSTRFAPLLCTDAAGRYLGVVHMERLLQAMAVLVDGELP